MKSVKRVKCVTKHQAEKLGEKFNINYKIVPFAHWWYGLNVELEHGTRNPLTNITNDNLKLTAKIALAHLMEFPNYYERLHLMEAQLDKQWQGQSPSIFN